MNKLKSDTADEMRDEWVWHSMVYRLCQELNYTPNKIYELYIIDTLNWLSFLKEKQDLEQKQRDKEKGITRI